MAVPDWPPTHIMKDLFDKNYKPQSGNNVKLDVDFIPWPDYYTRLNASLTSGEKKYNMAVSDSQWLGAFIEGGYYLKINKYVDADPGLQAVFKDLHPAVKAPIRPIRTSRTSSTASRRCRTSSINYYRKDVFCDPTEQKNFKDKYKYKLPCTPEEMDDITWDNFNDFGEFFQRKKGDMLMGKPLDDDFYGIEFQVGKGYDFFTTSAQRVPLAARRRHLGRDQAAERPRRRRRELADGGQGVRPLPLVREVHAAGRQDRQPRHLQDRRAVPRRQGREQPRVDRLRRKLDQPGDLEGRRQGRLRAVAGPQDRQGHRPLVANRRSAVRADDLEHGHPEQGGARLREVVAVEGHPDRLRQAGGQSALKSVYTDPSYVTFRPWNRTWAESLDWQKDFWHIPEFFELLTEQQEEYTKAVTGQQDAKTTLDNIANFQEKL